MLGSLFARCTRCWMVCLLDVTKGLGTHINALQPWISAQIFVRYRAAICQSTIFCIVYFIQLKYINSFHIILQKKENIYQVMNNKSCTSGQIPEKYEGCWPKVTSKIIFLRWQNFFYIIRVLKLYWKDKRQCVNQPISSNLSRRANLSSSEYAKVL